MDGDTTTGHPLERVRAIGQRPGIQAGRDRPRFDREGQRLGEAVRTDQAMREIESGPGRLPDPALYIPAADRGFQRGAGNTRGAIAEGDETTTVFERGLRDPVDRAHVLRDLV